MKNIIILIITTLLLTGCYDNHELNELSIISGIGIDYIDNNYVITIELYNDNKSTNTTDLISYTITGKGNTISKAFKDLHYRVSKEPCYSHIRLILLSESVINNHLENILDYIIRDTNIREDFILLVASNNSPEEILNNSDKKNPNVSNLIFNLINSEKYNNSVITNDNYQDIVTKLISKRRDIILNSITLEDDKISLSDSYLFNGYNYVYTLNKDNTSIYNILNNNSKSTILNKEYSNGNFTISINKSKTNIEVNNKKIRITIEGEAKVLENNPNFKLEDANSYKELNKDFSLLLKNDIISLIKLLKENNTDILGFRDMYYKKNNKELYNLWKTLELDVNTNITINSDGFIFKVNK